MDRKGSKYLFTSHAFSVTEMAIESGGFNWAFIHSEICDSKGLSCWSLFAIFNLLLFYQISSQKTFKISKKNFIVTIFAIINFCRKKKSVSIFFSLKLDKRLRWGESFLLEIHEKVNKVLWAFWRKICIFSQIAKPFLQGHGRLSLTRVFFLFIIWKLNCQKKKDNSSSFSKDKRSILENFKQRGSLWRN